MAFFGVWMMSGLFIDGWAHQANKPETFFSPWHGVLYSGFVAAVAWFAYAGRRSGRSLNPAGGLDRLAGLGFLLFAAGGVADGVWHEIFGVEADLEALVSPSHLALFFGGFLMVSSPLRLARQRSLDEPAREPRQLRWADWAPQGISLTLSTALIGFFTLYLSPFGGVGGDSPGNGRLGELLEVAGLASVLAFNLLLIGAFLFAVTHWRPPFGFATLLFGGVALGMAGLEGFALVELAIPMIVAGLVADLLMARRTPAAVAAPAVSAVMWVGYFSVAHLSYGITWTIELWAGSIVLAAAASALMATLVIGPRHSSIGDQR